MRRPGSARRQGETAKFVTGPLHRHILYMTGAGAIGVMAIFLGDLANIYFLSRLGDQSVVAAIGYASSVLVFTTSIGIGLSIATTSLVAPALGAGLRVRARRLSTNAHLLAFLVSAVSALIVWLFVGPLLASFGATGRTYALAERFLSILLPAQPLFAVGITSSAVLRSVGDPRRAMMITLSGAITNTVMDLLFIVKLGWGIEGAAVSSALARVAVVTIGLYGVVVIHKLASRPKLATLSNDAPAFAAVAIPAVLTNVATPVGNAYVTAAVAPFGDGAVAGWAIIGRIMPVAFGGIFALTGSVGPIIGQNFGARNTNRMRATLTQSLAVMTTFTAVAWVLLFAFAEPLAGVFNASGDARDLIVLFCRWLSPLFAFMGALFIANAVFNTLGHAHYSTGLNWARAIFGTVPFVTVGARIGDAAGAVAGQMIGGIAFGLLAVGLGYRLIGHISGRIGPAPGGG